MKCNKPTDIEVIPDIFLDPDTRKSYITGKLLGKGGLAKCYELTDSQSGKVYAGKIVSKKVLQDPHQKEIIANEISMNRLLVHNHIVGFHTCFENKDFVVIVFELCNRRSLMQLVKRRKTVTEPEARCFMHQLLLGVKHLHENKIIHRDLELSNLFLNDNMELKIGDLRLAVKLEFHCEKKMSVHGMSEDSEPKVLCQKDHNYQVDIWSTGCILYTLLVGQSPFEISSLEISDCNIGNKEVYFPSHIGPLARTFIISMLQAYPTSTRPTMDQYLNDDYMTKGYMPLRLPLSCLTMSPRFDPGLNNSAIVIGQPFAELNEMQVVQGSLINSSYSADTPLPAASPDPSHQLLLRDLKEQLSKFISFKPNEKVPSFMDEAEYPADVPMVYVSSYDYSDKFGFGYRMIDNTVGVFFNDFTNLSLHVDGKTVMYVEKDGIEQFDHTLHCYPAILFRKMELLCYYRSYWQEDLIEAERSDSSIPIAEIDKFSRLPFLRQWFRTSRSVVMHLSNGTFQVDYFQENVTMILCPLMGAVSIIDKDLRTFRLTSLAQHGCSNDLFQRLEDVRDKIDCFLEQNTNDLLLAIQSRQNATVNDTLCDTCPADVKAEGAFNWNGLFFERATPLFAALISDQILSIRLLVTRLPHFQFQSFISNGNLETEVFQLDLLELVGASCIVNGDESVLSHGFDCWRKALEIRYGENGLMHPKENVEQSYLEKIALRHTREFESLKELNLLVHQRRKENWKLQAFLVSRRILMKYGLFPNRFFVTQIHQATFLTWNYHQLNRTYLFCYCLYLMEIFPPIWLKRQESSDIPWSVIDSMLEDFRRIVFDQSWCLNQQFEEEAVLSVDRLIMALDFVCAYFVCLHEMILFSYPQPEKRDKLERIIIQMLVLLDLTKLSSGNNERVCNLLREHFAVFYERGIHPNLLIIACTLLTNNSAFEVVEILLKTGLSPFLTDSNGRSPLHLLTKAEVSMAPWESANYPIRAEMFTRCVIAFLKSKCKYDFIDRQGKSALDCFQKTHHLYPNESFRLLLRDFFYLSVRPLSCLSAKIIQKHKPLITEVPHHLQLFVKRH